MPATAEIVPAERIQSRILVLRGQRVLLDADLAAFFEVTTKQLNQAVKRNAGKFPDDFVFQLTREEITALHVSRASSVDNQAITKDRSQIVTGVSQNRARQHLPFAFTEHGAIQAANVLSSPAATRMGIAVVRAFVQLRALMVDHKTLRAKLAELDARVGAHDEQLAAIVEAIRELRSASPTLRWAPRRRAPSLRYGAARFTRDHLRASRSVAVPVESPNKRKIGYHVGNR